MSIYLSGTLRGQLEEADNHCCAYCQTTQANCGQRMVPDYIIPDSKGGKTVFENLCFACRRCNEFKSSRITGVDPLTGQTVTLFHAHQQSWFDHFSWEESGA